MKKRKLTLPSGWVAGNAEEMALFVAEWGVGKNPHGIDSPFLLLPHAGWYYSGEYAWNLLSTLPYKPDLVLILGGHLSPQDPLLIWDYSVCESTLGDVPIHRGLTDDILQALKPQPDSFPDNTIEVFLPFLAHLWPGVPMAGLRIPPDVNRLDQAESLHSLIHKHARRPLCIASTDLTHYGRNYRFLPDLEGLTPEEWVRQNDRKFIDAVESAKAEMVLDSASLYTNACSAGAAAWVVHCAAMDQKALKLTSYGSSLDKGVSESFVGYASMASRARS